MAGCHYATMELVYYKPLVTVDKETCVVSLKHKTVREYFTKEQLIGFVERVKDANANSKMKYWRNKRKALLASEARSKILEIPKESLVSDLGNEEEVEIPKLGGE